MTGDRAVCESGTISGKGVQLTHSVGMFSPWNVHNCYRKEKGEAKETLAIQQNRIEDQLTLSLMHA